MAHTHTEHVYHEGRTDNSGMSFLLGVILLLAVLFMLFYFGSGILSNIGTTTQPQINVPEQVDVNVNQK